MLLTKELAAKGSAILGASGAGGTGLYYAGDYLYGSSNHKGVPFIGFMKKKKGNNVVFEVKKGDQKISLNENDVNFSDGNPFEVIVTTTSTNNTELESSTSVPWTEGPKLSCTFRFEVVGKHDKQTINPDHKSRP